MEYVKLLEIYSNYRVEPTEYKCGQIPWTYEPEDAPDLYSEDGMLMDANNVDAWIEHKRVRNPGMSIQPLDQQVIDAYGLDISFDRIFRAPKDLYVCLRVNEAGKPTYTYFFGVAPQDHE